MSRLREGRIEYFCNCLLKNFKEHIVSVDSDGACCYCGYTAIRRGITRVDITSERRHKATLEKLKLEHLDIMVKDNEHGEKVS